MDGTRASPSLYVNAKKRCDATTDLPVGLEDIETATSRHITATVVLSRRKTFSRSYGKNSRFKRTREEAIKLCKSWRDNEIKTKFK
jgi:hypothetical protein